MAQKKTKVEVPQTEVKEVVDEQPTPETMPEGTQEQKAPADPATETNDKVDSPETVETDKNTDTKEPTKEKVAETDKAVSKDIPAAVQAVLKRFPNEKELYVDTFGGVYTNDTKPSVRGSAILYRNPFYKQ